MFFSKHVQSIKGNNVAKLQKDALLRVIAMDLSTGMKLMF